MLTIPTNGFYRSIKEHNVRLDVLCDWIESSVLFDDGELSVTDIADFLIEEKIYDQQDLASEGVIDALSELRKRHSWLGNEYGFYIKNRFISSENEWRKMPAYTFCILLSLAPFYDWWKEKNYNEQGELFELLTKESIEAQFKDWEIYHTGWSRGNTAGFEQVVNEVAERLGENIGDFALWNEPNAKERGLDLLCYRPFPDKRRGIPVYLMQCASGGNWESKLHTPDLSLWKDVINFKNEPVKAFSVPFLFLDDQFTKNSVLVKGLLLDRCRLLAASRYRKNWISKNLKESILAWSKPRIDALLNKSK